MGFSEKLCGFSSSCATVSLLRKPLESPNLFQYHLDMPVKIFNLVSYTYNNYFLTD